MATARHARRSAAAIPGTGSAARWGWGGAIAGALLAFVLNAPATWLAGAVARATGSRVLLNDARGTVWNGSAQFVLTGGPGSRDMAALADRLQWNIRPRWNGLQMRLHAPCCSPQPVTVRTRLGIARTHTEIDAGDFRAPAAVLAGLGTPWNTLQLDGELHLSTQGLSVEWAAGRLAIAGQAQLQARNISSRLSTLRPMGSYRITLQGGSIPTVRLDTLEGALRLSGSGQWAGNRMRFMGEASADPDRLTALSNLLNIIGRRSGPRSIITIG